MLKAVLSSDASGLIKNTDADKDMDTVNRVETMESHFNHLDLSSPHHDLSGTYRVHMHQSKPCLEGKPLCTSPTHHCYSGPLSIAAYSRPYCTVVCVVSTVVSSNPLKSKH